MARSAPVLPLPEDHRERSQLLQKITFVIGRVVWVISAHG
jgi:hypothetical protein